MLATYRSATLERLLARFLACDATLCRGERRQTLLPNRILALLTGALDVGRRVGERAGRCRRRILDGDLFGNARIVRPNAHRAGVRPQQTHQQPPW